MGSRRKNREMVTIAHRRQQVGELLLTGHSHYAIAAKLGVSRPTISGDVAALVAEWRATAASDVAQAKAEELAKIAYVEAQAFIGWQRSLRVAKTQTNESSPGGTKRTDKRQGQAGNPRFLEVALSAGESRRKLLGLDAPTKLAATTADGGDLPLAAIDVEALNEGELLAFQSLCTQLIGDATDGDYQGTAEPSD